MAQLLLDPYYRTMRGFQVLIEKEWLSFGHQFVERGGRPQLARDVGKLGVFEQESTSPVFLQFLECVHHIMSQFPAAMAFNEVRCWDHQIPPIASARL